MHFGHQRSAVRIQSSGNFLPSIVFKTVIEKTKIMKKRRGMGHLKRFISIQSFVKYLTQSEEEFFQHIIKHLSADVTLEYCDSYLALEAFIILSQLHSADYVLFAARIMR